MVFEALRVLDTESNLHPDANQSSGILCHHECDSNCEFQELMAALLYLLLIWLFGRIALCLRMPTLVGEIVCGIVFGPNLLNIVPLPESFVLIGEVGLALLVVEAGLDVDLDMLRLIGVRGVCVAVFGSMVPLAIGFMLAKGVLHLGDTAAFIVGASLAPTSMGIALNVLKKHRAQNTPTGQLVIAAAVLDDIIALILLSEVDALRHGSSAWAYVQPVVVAVALLVCFGVFAIFIFPRLVEYTLYHVAPEHHENFILGLIFVFAIGLAYLVRLAGSSHLLGCFIAGLCFCTLPIAHHIWADQVKRILNWLLRVFFSATIGFEVPVKNFQSGEIIAHGCLLLIPVIGKLLTGFWAKPLDMKNGLTVAFAMSAWGEFAFILIVEAKNDGIIDVEVFSAVVLAILLSVILAPIGLRAVLVYFNRKSEAAVAKAMKVMHESDSKDKIPLYYWIHSSSRIHWGQQDAILRAIYTCNVQVMDLRTYRFDHEDLDVQVVYDIYVKDPNFSLSKEHYRHPTDEENKHIEAKCFSLHHAILQALKEDKPSVRVGRWFAGIKTDTDDHESTAHSTARSYFSQRSTHHESIVDSINSDEESSIHPSYLEGFIKHDPLDVMLYAESVRPLRGSNKSSRSSSRRRHHLRSRRNSAKKTKKPSHFAELKVITSNIAGSHTIKFERNKKKKPHPEAQKEYATSDNTRSSLDQNGSSADQDNNKFSLSNV